MPKLYMPEAIVYGLFFNNSSRFYKKKIKKKNINNVLKIFLKKNPPDPFITNLHFHPDVQAGPTKELKKKNINNVLRFLKKKSPRSLYY